MFGLCGFLTPFIGGAINLSLPFIGKEFNMTVVSLSWIATAYLLSTTVFLVPFGRLADILGRKKIFLYGATIFTIATLMCCIAPSGTFLMTFRAFQGLGSAMIFGTSMAILISIFPQRERGKAIGINLAGTYLGSSLGPVLGGTITHYWGWRWIFLFTAILGAIVVGMGRTYLQSEWKEAHGETFDIKGSILYGISIIAILLGTTLLPSIHGYISIAIGIILFILFCYMQETVKHPIFDINILLKNKRFAMANVAALLNFSAAFAVPFLLSLYLQYVKGLDPHQAGLILLTSALTMAIGSPLTGKLSDSIDPKILASSGMGLASTALLIMSFIINAQTPLYLIICLLFLFGCGMSLFASPNTNAAMASVSKRHMGLASSILGTMRMFGQTISMGITMLILSIFVGKNAISSAVVHNLIKSTQMTFFIFGCLCACGIFASLARGKHTETITEEEAKIIVE